jgi:hypothetical protein
MYEYNYTSITGELTGNYFETFKGSGNPQGIISIDENYLWISDSSDDALLKYYYNGTYAGEKIDTSYYGATNPKGMSYNGTWLFLADSSADEIFYLYPNNFSYANISFDTAIFGATTPYGVAYDNSSGYFYVTDYSDNGVYRILGNGTYSDDFYYTTGFIGDAGEKTSPSSINIENGIAYIMDLNNYIGYDGIYLFNITGEPYNKYIQYKIYFNNGNNLSDTPTLESISLGSEPDSIPPYFTTIPENDTILYLEDWTGVDFDAEDETSFNSFSVNDSRFTINSTGFLDNASELGVGVYILNITINDTSNNLNSTIYQLEINKSTSNCQVLFNETSPLIYPSTFKAYTDCNTEFTLKRNGTTITNNSEQTLSAGIYNFTVERADIINYTNIYDEELFTISQTSSLVYTYLNNSRANVSIYGGDSIWLNGTLEIGEGEIKLYNNGTLINMGTSPISNLTDFNATGLYNITAIYEGNENYTSSFETWWINVISTIDITPPNISLIYPEAGTEDSDGVVNFIFNSTDLRNITNCSLYSQFGLYITKTNIINGINTIEVSSITSGNALYSEDLQWYIKCTDDLNNIGNSTIRHLDTIPPYVGNPGGGGGATTDVTDLNKNPKYIELSYPKTWLRNSEVQIKFYAYSMNESIYYPKSMEYILNITGITQGDSVNTEDGGIITKFKISNTADLRNESIKLKIIDERTLENVINFEVKASSTIAENITNNIKNNPYALAVIIGGGFFLVIIIILIIVVSVNSKKKEKA